MIMEGYQSCVVPGSSGEFCNEVDEFYNILETMSALPFAATIGEVEVCSRCKSAPCSCCSAPKASSRFGGQKRDAAAVVEDYPISASGESPGLPSGLLPKKARTVGIVEPRVVVRIPWTKIGGKKVNLTPDAHAATTPDHDGFQRAKRDFLQVCNWSGVKSPMGPGSNAQMVTDVVSDGSSLSRVLGGDHVFLGENLAKMKTNGSHSGHIQVDRQTIETALHDEVAAPPAPPFHVLPSSSTEEALGNEEKAEIMSSGRKQQLPAVHKKKEGNAELESLDSILDNFLITTTSSAVDEQLPSQMDVSNPSKSESDDSITKFSFEEDDDDDGKQWMFCHVPGCSFWTSKSSRMERHNLCHSEPTELEVKRCYKCPDCHLKFYSLAKLLKHDRRKHTGVKDYECRICEAEVTDIQVHMRIHADEKHHYCEHCPLSFRHKSSLVRHMFLHTGERPYRCQSCQSSFTARDRLKGHILKHHPDHPAAQELHSLNKPGGEENQNNDVLAPKKQQKRRKRKCKQSDAAVLAENHGGQLTLEIPPDMLPNNESNFILHLPTSTAYLQINPDGNLCWQQQPEFSAAANFDAGNHSVNEASSSQNPLDVAIKEIITTVEVPVVNVMASAASNQENLSSQMTRFADKLKSLREQYRVVPKDNCEKLYCCDKCGREYKYKSFLQVHQKRRCW